jgi:glycosyltransferase involved in cell wall biosynthesis
MPLETIRVGYVLKMYPRFSETFIVNEILAHEAAGLDLEIFSLRLPVDGRFHEALSRVSAPVTYLPSGSVKGSEFWGQISEASEELPGLWPALATARGEDVRDVYQALLLARAATARKITHLHAHFGSVATTVARLASRFAGLTYSFTAHAKDIYHQSVWPADLRCKLRDAAAVITISDHNLRYLCQSYGLAAARVQRVYNGLNLQQFTYNSPADRPAWIVAVGRLVEKKGFADLLDGCAILARRGRDFRCEIIGAGSLEADLRAQINRLGLQGQVELLGPQPQGRVIQHIQKAAVLAAPCVVGADGNRDGLPTVLLEATALGTPCVSTEVTGIPEVLRHGETGLMVPQHDAAALAAALERLLDDPPLRLRLATGARRLIETEFDIHRNAASIRKIFATAVRSASTVAAAAAGAGAAAMGETA